MTAPPLFADTTTDSTLTDARNTTGRFATSAMALQTRYENAYADAVHAAYLRSNPRAAARRHHAADGALSRRLAHECGLSLAYGVRVGVDGRLTRCYGAAMKPYWER